MALKHVVVTIGASATQLSSTRESLKWLKISNPAGNDLVKIGASTVSGTDYGDSISAGESVEIGPFGQGAVNTTEIYFSGTNTEKVYILYVTH